MTDFLFRRPRMAILLIGLILVAGFSSFQTLPRMEDPILTERFATVNTVYPGADAERVETLISDRIEDALREVDEIHTMRSMSRTGVSTIALELADDVYAVDEVWSRVRDKIDDATRQFPEEAIEPEFRRTDMKAYAMLVALSWDATSPTNYAILRRLAESLEDRLLAIRGTEKARVFGDPQEEIVVTIDPRQLALLELSALDVASALGASDSKISAGVLRGEQSDVLLEVAGEFDSLQRISKTPILVGEDGHVVRLGDVAKLQKGIAEPAEDMALVGGRDAVVVALLVKDNYRIDRWTQKVDRALQVFREEVPTGVRLEKIFEQNQYVTSRLGALLRNLLLGVLGVMSVVLFIMGWRSALIVGVTLPLSALMVIAGLGWMGIPIHQMSVTGLIIALGLLIDNAIVMVDEVSGRLRTGESPGSAVRGTVRHLAIPLLGSTVTTALAFAPLALMPGPAGEFVGSIGISVMLAIFSSLFLAMTLVPALTAWVIRAPQQDRSTGWWNHGFDYAPLAAAYRQCVAWSLRHPWRGMAIGVVLPLLGFLAAMQLPEQFFPPADRNQFQIEVELPAQSSLRNTAGLVQQIRELALDHAEVERVEWFLGESAPAFYYNIIPRRRNTPNYAHALVETRSVDNTRQTIRQLQQRLDRTFPQARILVRQLEQGPPFDAPIEVRIFGPDLERLCELGDQVRQRLAKLPNVVHTRADLAEVQPKLAWHLDEEQALLAGLDASGIARQMQATLEGALRGSVLESTEELPVRLRLENAARADLGQIASIDLQRMTRSARGDEEAHIPLTALAEPRMVPESSTIQRYDGSRMNEVQAYVTAGVLPDTVLTKFKRSILRDPLDLPAGYSLQLGGETAERDEAVGNLFASVSVLAVLMVAMLVWSFGSFRMSGIIGLVAGLSLGLGLGALWVFGYPFGFMAIVGSMGLMGVAINDSIVVLAGIRADEHARTGDAEAIGRVVLYATRHVLATTLTTVAGFLPLVMAGGEFWPPLAVAIAGGVSGATLLALFLVPSSYRLLSPFRPRDKGQPSFDSDATRHNVGKTASAFCYSESL